MHANGYKHAYAIKGYTDHQYLGSVVFSESLTFVIDPSISGCAIYLHMLCLSECPLLEASSAQYRDQGLPYYSVFVLRCEGQDKPHSATSPPAEMKNV